MNSDPHLESTPREAAHDGAAHPDDRLVRELGFSDTTLLLVSSVIGAGIFLTPGVVAEAVPDPKLFLLAWLVGGCISLAGALGNAELGAMFPRAGGDYVYLREAFHPTAGFLVGWLSFFVIYAGTVATLATGFAEGVERLLALGGAGKIALAIAVTLATTWVNWVGLRTGASFNNVTAVLKIGTLALLVVAGWLFAPASGAEPLSALEGTSLEVGAPTASGFALAMSPILFSYLGWNAPVYVASEIREPGTTIPRALFVGLGICTALYLAVNALYVRTLPLEHLIGASDAGEASARALFGGVGGVVAAILILLSVLGCLNATILVGPRIAYAMALDGHFFPGAERVHDRYRTPHIALAAQAAFSIALILVLRRFPSVLDYTTFAIVLATMADIAALYALRVRQPARPRPYRAWGYPLVPALYFLANGAIAVALLRGRPIECLIALLVAASGLPFLWAFSQTRAKRVR